MEFAPYQQVVCHCDSHQHIAHMFDFDCDCAAVASAYNTTQDAAAYAPYPRVYALELTPECQNMCAGCGTVFPHMQPNNGVPLDSVQWAHVLATIAPHAERLKITGGEPTLHPHFLAILDAIRHKNIPFTLFTNGRWRNRGVLLNVLATMPQCTGLLVSLHGADAHAHDTFTGVAGSLNETLATIQAAVQHGIEVYTNTVLTSFNVHQVRAIRRVAQLHGASCSIFSRFIGIPVPGWEVDHTQLETVLHAIEHDAVAGYAMRIGSPLPACRFPGALQCAAGIDYCTIDPWGFVRPCSHAPTIAGNLFTESLETIWHADTFQRWRAMIPMACQSCALVAQCHGGCRADVMLKGSAGDALIQCKQVVAH